MTMAMKRKNESEALRNILLIISYDGSRFHGWQAQQVRGCEEDRTVQGVIESALAKMHGHRVPLIGSGRTDSGVHAVGQAANFYTDIASIPEDRFVPALNSLLPRDVRILSSRSVHPDFNARFSARGRTYRYFLNCALTPFAHEIPYSWHIGRRPDLVTLNRMAAYLCGEIDFTTFTAAGDQSPSRCRYMYGASFFPEGNKVVFEISANAFLWKMVRSLTGTLLHLEKSGAAPEVFKQILDERNRSLAGPTAPAEGLFLWHVRYDSL